MDKKLEKQREKIIKQLERSRKMALNQLIPIDIFGAIISAVFGSLFGGICSIFYGAVGFFITTFLFTIIFFLAWILQRQKQAAKTLFDLQTTIKSFDYSSQK